MQPGIVTVHLVKFGLGNHMSVKTCDQMYGISLTGSPQSKQLQKSYASTQSCSYNAVISTTEQMFDC